MPFSTAVRKVRALWFSDGKQVREHKAMGLVPEIFNEQILNDLKGDMALGHVRYSTTGSSLLVNAQPFRVRHSGRSMSIAITATSSMPTRSVPNWNKTGPFFQTTMDSEVVLHLTARRLNLGMEQAMIDTMSQLRGAYSVVVMTEDSLIAAKDPNGFRPLCLGKTQFRLRPGFGDLCLRSGGGGIHPVYRTRRNRHHQ